ncbi:hypothetical protein M885DRAFT_531688 [Pelagophyceae sp. CCMP2097]|nr:hypothetical protein M885DRAFT_531688 [Pelagophyceae sp. CCMP2097]
MARVDEGAALDASRAGLRFAGAPRRPGEVPRDVNASDGAAPAPAAHAPVAGPAPASDASTSEAPEASAPRGPPRGRTAFAEPFSRACPPPALLPRRPVQGVGSALARVPAREKKAKLASHQLAEYYHRSTRPDPQPDLKHFLKCLISLQSPDERHFLRQQAHDDTDRRHPAAAPAARKRRGSDGRGSQGSDRRGSDHRGSDTSTFSFERARRGSDASAAHSARTCGGPVTLRLRVETPRLGAADRAFVFTPSRAAMSARSASFRESDVLLLCFGGSAVDVALTSTSRPASTSRSASPDLHAAAAAAPRLTDRLGEASLHSTSLDYDLHARSLRAAGSIDSGAFEGYDSTRLAALRLYAYAAPPCEASAAAPRRADPGTMESSSEEKSYDAGLSTKASVDEAPPHKAQPSRRHGDVGCSSAAQPSFTEAEDAFRNAAGAGAGAAKLGQLPPFRACEPSHNPYAKLSSASQPKLAPLAPVTPALRGDEPLNAAAAPLRSRLAATRIH